MTVLMMKNYLFYLTFLLQVFLQVIVCQKQNGCSVQIVVDPFLQEHLRETFYKQRSSELDVRRKIIFFVGQHFRFVNSVLEKYSFLPSGDPIKLFPQKIKILDFTNCVYQGANYCHGGVDLLSAHSSVDQSDFCLSFVFTFQDLKDGYLGMAYTASPNQADEGGLCSQFSAESDSVVEDLDEEDEDSDLKENEKSDQPVFQSRNTGLVSFKYNGVQVPDFVSKLSFLHEIGHSLGSPHDYPANCLHSETGFYVMNPMGGLNGFLDTNYQFSDCSIKNISLTMAALKTLSRNCLQQVPASVCGNGLVEGWEECDCGADQEECSLDKCCYPADHPESACQRKPNAICSLSEGACCTDDCYLLTKVDEFICSEESDCSFSATCDGTQSSCPNAKPKSNSNTCREGTMICQNGECGQSICTRFNLIPCRAASDNPCEIHCQTPKKPETCAPTSENGPLFPEPLHQPLNTFCHTTDATTNLTTFGYCSSSHYCASHLEESGLSNTSWIVGLIVFLACYVVVVAVGFWIYCRYCRGSLRRNRTVLGNN